MSTLSNISERLSALFYEYDYQWSFEEGKSVPTEDDIAKTLDGMRTRLYDEKDPLGSIEVGRIRMQRNADHAEVYLFIGDYDEQDS